MEIKQVAWEWLNTLAGRLSMEVEAGVIQGDKESIDKDLDAIAAVDSFLESLSAEKEVGVQRVVDLSLVMTDNMPAHKLQQKAPDMGYSAKATAREIRDSVVCSVELVEEVMEDPEDLWNAEFYAGAGTRLKDALRNSPELLDPAVVETHKGALEGTVEEYYSKVFARYELREKVRRFFESYDLLLTPTLPVPPFGAGINVPPELPERSIVSWVYYTYPFNLTGNPAASIPCGFTGDGLPVGLQMVTGTNRETDLLRAAAAFEKAHPWARIVPGLEPEGSSAWRPNR